jgi:hypothetical protein
MTGAEHKAIRWQPPHTPGLVAGVACAFLCGAVVATLASAGYVLWVAFLLLLPVAAALLVWRVPFHPTVIPFLLALPLTLIVGLAWGQAISFFFVLASLAIVRNPPTLTPRLRVGLIVGGAAIFLGLFVGLLNRNNPFLLIGDLAQYLAFYLAVLASFRQRVDVTSPRTLFLLGAATVATFMTDIATNHVVFSDVLGNIARHIDFVAGFVFIWAVACALWRRGSIAGLLVAVVSGLSVVLSFTRGLWLGTVLGALVIIVLYVARSKDSRKARRVLTFIGLLLIIAPAFAITSGDLAQAATHRVISIVNLQQDPEWQRRQLETTMALSQLDSPVVGKGLGATVVGPSGLGYLQIGEIHFLHNQYIAMVLRVGIFGFALVAFSLWALRPLSVRTPRGAAALGSIGFALATGISSPILFIYPMNLFVGLAIGGALREEKVPHD